MPTAELATSSIRDMAYLASAIEGKPNQFERREGYLLCCNVPFCRSGFQDYLGSELKRHPDYRPEWDLQDGTIYPVYRSIEEVTSPATIASFEGVSLVDGHPPDDVSIVHLLNDHEYNQGHVQNIRVGPALSSGAIPLLGDFHVKDPNLADKISSGGIRETSAGYFFTLIRAADGTLCMIKIQGNHVAVVPKGRAGAEVSIRDAAPPEQKKEKYKLKNLMDLIGLGAKEYAKDAQPSEVASMLSLFSRDGKAEPVTPPVAAVALDAAAITKIVTDANKATLVAIDTSVSAKLAEFAKTYKLKTATDDLPDLENMDDADPDDKKDDDEEEKKKKKDAADKAAKDAGEDINVLVLDPDEQGKHVLEQQIAADALPSKEWLKMIQPVLPKNKAAIDGFNKLARAVKGTVDHGSNAYRGLARTRGAGLDAVSNKPAKPALDPAEFFIGKTHKDGLAAYEKALAAHKSAA
jgi:hypothetical protein